MATRKPRKLRRKGRRKPNVLAKMIRNGYRQILFPMLEGETTAQMRARIWETANGKTGKR